MRKSISWIMAILMISSLSFGKWVYDSDFAVNSQPHGVVVAPDGKIWVGYYGYTDTLGLPNDTIPIKPIYVFNADGSQASFSPIEILSWADSRQDTMWNGCRGISQDKDGNILYSAYNDVWQINYQTGEPMGALYDFPGSVTEAAVNADGYMFITQVVPSGNPIWVFDASLGLPSTETTALDWADGLVNEIDYGTSSVIGRNVLTNASGTDVYQGKIYGGTHNNGMLHFVGDDPEAVFNLDDRIWREVMWVNALDWGLDSTIWMGTYWDVSEGDFTGYYAVDPSAGYQIVNTIGTGPELGHSFGSVSQGDTVYAPRGISFSADSMTAYVADFDGNRILKFTEDGSGAGDVPTEEVPTTSDWVYDSDFAVNSQPHGVVVAPDGKIWVGYYGYTDTLGLPNDTIPIKPIYVFNADGSQASFSPIEILSWADSRQDTMWNGCRGISQDKDGNILYSAYNDVWQINYQTGEPMGALYDFPGSVTEAAVNADGYMFITQVVPSGNPIWVFDASLGLPSTETTALDWADGLVNEIDYGTSSVIGRNVLTNASGTDVYQGKIYGGTHNNGMLHFVGDDPEAVFNLDDRIWREVMWVNALDWGLDSTIWMGTYWDVSEGDFTGYYAVDPSAGYQIVNTIGTGPELGHSFGSVSQGDTVYAPRGVAFTDDGDYAYVADFDGNRILKFRKSGVSIDPTITSVPLEFKLNQNYPNPFNPTTNINFDLYKAGHIKLTVYDLLGRQVAVLVDKEMKVGNHTITFDAHNFASGMYIYTLQTDNKMMSKRMTLIK